MQITIPFLDTSSASDETVWNTIHAMEKATKGGVYPLASNGLWHTAIHLNSLRPHYQFIHPIMDGTVIAYRIPDHYESIKQDSDALIPHTDDITFKLENLQKKEPHTYKDLAGTSSINDLLKMIANKTYDQTLKEKLQKLLYRYSTAFVLMQHTLPIPHTGDTITYYLLYSNIAPSCEYTIESENDRCFFRQWQIKSGQAPTAFQSVSKRYPLYAGEATGDVRHFIHDDETLSLIRKPGTNIYKVLHTQHLCNVKESCYIEFLNAHIPPLNTATEYWTYQAQAHTLALYYDSEKTQCMILLTTTAQRKITYTQNIATDKVLIHCTKAQDYEYSSFVKQHGYILQACSKQIQGKITLHKTKNDIYTLSEKDEGSTANPFLHCLYEKKEKTLFIPEGITIQWHDQITEGTPCRIKAIVFQEHTPTMKIPAHSLVITADTVLIPKNLDTYYLCDSTKKKYRILSDISKTLSADSPDLKKIDAHWYHLTLSETESSLIQFIDTDSLAQIADSDVALIEKYQKKKHCNTHQIPVSVYSPLKIDQTLVSIYAGDGFKISSNTTITAPDFKIYTAQRVSSGWNLNGAHQTGFLGFAPNTSGTLTDHIAQAYTATKADFAHLKGKQENNTFVLVYTDASSPSYTAILAPSGFIDNTLILTQKQKNLEKRIAVQYAGTTGFLSRDFSKCLQSQWYTQYVDASTFHPYTQTDSSGLDIHLASPENTIHLSGQDSVCMQSHASENDVHIELFLASLKGFDTSAAKKPIQNDPNEILLIQKKSAPNHVLALIYDDWKAPQASDDLRHLIICSEKKYNSFYKVLLASLRQFTASFTILENTTISLQFHSALTLFSINNSFSLPNDIDDSKQLPLYYLSYKSGDTLLTDANNSLYEIRKDRVYLFTLNADNTHSDSGFLYLEAPADSHKTGYICNRLPPDSYPLIKQKDSLFSFFGETYTWHSHPPVLHVFEKPDIDLLTSCEKVSLATDARLAYADALVYKDSILIEIEGALRRIKSKSITRTTLNDTIFKHNNKPILQYNVLALPFFNQMTSKYASLICDIPSINQYLHRAISETIYKDHSRTALMADAIYSMPPDHNGISVYEKLNSLLIHAPSIWEYLDQKLINVYDYMYSPYLTPNQREHIKEYIYKQMVLTKDVKKLMGIPSSQKQYYFFHPLSFLEYVTNDIDLSFNPYRGKAPVFLQKSTFVHQNRTQKLDDNPGFAPYNESKKTDYTYDGNYFAPLTCHFDVKRGENKARHTGVDFGSWQKSVPIKSFIYGTIWACTWQGSVTEKSSGYGKVMIIKGDDMKLYLLAHLSSFLQNEGDRIYPGIDVAMSGQTGNSTGYHLHLEVFQTDIHSSEIKENKDTVLNKNACKRFEEGTGLLWVENFNQKEKRVNPFNHNDKAGTYGG